MLKNVTRTMGQLSKILRLMVGVPEYSTYVDYMKMAHPDQSIMSYEEFFRERQEARYGSKGRLNRCC